MKKLALLLPVLLAGAFLLSTARGQAQAPTPQPYPTGQYPAEVTLASAADLQVLYQLNIDIGSLRAADGTFPAAGEPFETLIATVYITRAEAQALANVGLAAVPIPNPSQQNGPHQPGDWPTFNQVVSRMQGLASAYPNLVRLVSIGQSAGINHYDIWCLKITDNPDAEEDEPEVKYSAAIHGDELTGIEITLRLAELLTGSYGNAPYLTSLVDEMEIWLCPISNPDGYVSGNRYNAHGVDLNRDFPDRFIDPVDDPVGHEPETQAFMYFGYDHRFVMGANYHGGEQVVNYPWDAVTAGSPIPPNPTPSPDDSLFHDFSVGYAIRNPYIWNGSFPEGVTRGWEWYQIWGGMQDWAYLWRGEHHVTIELTYDKNPPYNTMDAQWDANRDAMIWWMSRALTGIRGLVTDAETGAPLDAVVQVQDMDAPNSVRTDPQAGDYHRVIGPGMYTLQASAACYQDATAPVTVTAGFSATVQDFQLVPSNWLVEGTVTDWSSGHPLTATVEVVEAGLVTATNPLDGSYAYELCGGTYTLRASAPGYQTEERQITVEADQVQNFALHLNPCTLLVDDDLGQNYQIYYQNALAAAGEAYDTWSVVASGSPSAGSLANYGRVVWLTGDDYLTSLTASDQANLASYLDGGGRLFLSGQLIGADIQNTSFYTSYLHADQNTSGESGYNLTGAGYLDGLRINLQGGDGAGNQDYRSDVTPINGAQAVFDYDPPYLAGGVAYQDGTYGMVYFSFGFEGIDNAADRTAVMQRTLDWLGNCQPSPSGLYTSEKQASANSAVPGEVVSYTVTLRNTSEPATDSLTDTLPAGLTFSGYLTATQGTPIYQGSTISWQGLLPTGGSVTITYIAALNQCLATGTAMANNAQLTDGLGTIITRTATVIVENAAPSIPQALAPVNEASGVPLNVQLAWQSTDPNCDELTYSLAFGTSSAPPSVAVDLTTPSYDPGLLQPETAYYWYVIAQDGTVSVTSPIWSFTTGTGFNLYLPPGRAVEEIKEILGRFGPLWAQIDLKFPFIPVNV